MHQAIRDQALALGFVAVRFAPVALPPGAPENLAGYLAQGCHGDMLWMAKQAERRATPAQLWPEARSVIVLGENYAPAGDPLALLAHPDRGNISVYARGSDYHDRLKKRLKALAHWLVARYGGEARLFTDTAPVMEKPLAALAGIGWQGRHTNLVSRDFGSWLFLGEIFTSLELTPDPPARDHCGHCHACESVCPTGALAKGRIDPRRCISYLTIEHQGTIPEALRPLMGNRIYGCDDCLAVCPWNKFAKMPALSDYRPRMELSAPRLADLASLDEAGFRALFAGSPIKRIGRDRFLRNVMIAIGNSGRSDLAPAAEVRLADASPLVREMALWALAQLLR